MSNNNKLEIDKRLSEQHKIYRDNLKEAQEKLKALRESVEAGKKLANPLNKNK